MANCRYRQGVRCDGPGTLKVSTGEPSDSCLECDGPKDEPKTSKREEEVKAVAQGVKGTSTVGSCDRCGKEAKLGTSKHAPGKRLCVSCTVRALKRSKQGLPLDEKGGGRMAAVSLPAGPRPVKKEKPNPRPTPVHDTRPEAIQAAKGQSIVLRITCHEIDHVRRVLSATSGMSVHVGLE